MNVLQSALLGLVQGLGEFLPVSSSGHLLLARFLMGIQGQSAQVQSSWKVLDILLHVGTLIPLLLVFWKDWWAMLRHPVRNRTLFLLLVASLPTLLVYFAAKKLFPDVGGFSVFDNGWFLGASFLITALFLLICDLLVVMTMLFSRQYSTLEYLLVIVTYVSIAILQSLTIMFRLETDLSGRMHDYHILSQVGVSEAEKNKIMHSEVSKFYLLILALVIIYAGTAFFSLYRSGQASTSQILFLSAAAILPLIVTDVLTRIYYGQVIKEPLRD